MVQPHYHPCSADCPDGLLAGSLVRHVGVDGFSEGWSAAVDSLALPICAAWLASVSDLPVERAQVLMLELRELLVKAAA